MACTTTGQSCESGLHKQNYHEESPKSEALESNLHSSDEEFSISAEESLVSSLSGNTTTSPRAFTSIAIRMSTLQASFAEKTAEEMKQIVDWYSSNNKEDLFTKVSQSQAFPDNPLACLDDDPNGATMLLESRQTDAEVKQVDMECKNTGCSTPKSNHDAISSDEDDQSTDYLPDLAFSPTSIDSPEAKEMVYSSSQEAQKQHQEVQDLVEATKYMAHIIDHWRSASDNVAPMKESSIRRRRLVRERTLTTESPRKFAIRKHRKLLDRQSRTLENWGVRLSVAVLLASLAWYCGQTFVRERGMPACHVAGTTANLQGAGPQLSVSESSDQCHHPIS